MTLSIADAIPRAGKIAILIPTFNSGLLLAETVRSIARAGLPVGSYEIVITDNASDDGSVERLPSSDELGAGITVHRNLINLGRVENWNRALQVAEEMGFQFATFLMTGDTLRDNSLVKLRDRMIRSGAALGLASYEVVDERLRGLRVARRMHWRGDPELGMPPDRFLEQSLATGAMLYGPLGANLYRIDGSVHLRFDATDASHTDQTATALFAHRCGRPIVYLDRPVSCWRNRASRFHNSIAPWKRLESDRLAIEHVCRAANITPDYPKLRATLILRGVALGASDVCAIRKNIRNIVTEGPVSWQWLACLSQRWLAYRTPWVIEA